MPYRKLGRTGLPISALAFGSYVTFANQLDVEGAKELLQLSFEAGVNFFDNAETYAAGASERIMGQAIEELAWPRDGFLVSSKVFFGALEDPSPTQRGLHRKHVRDACDAALERLRVDYLDLYFCHRPDPSVPIEETVRAMDQLVRDGKVLYWGTSEWSARQIREAFQAAERLGMTPPSMEQPQYNMLVRERFELEYAPLFRRYGIGTTTWGPLRSGILSGKYANGIPEDARLGRSSYSRLREFLDGDKGREVLKVVERLAGIARRLEATSAQLAIAWCLTNENVSSVILGASSTEQLQENLGSLEVLERLDAPTRSEIETLLRPIREHRSSRFPGGRLLRSLWFDFGS